MYTRSMPTCPSYGKVMETLSNGSLHKCFVALEVVNNGSKSIAEEYLKAVAEANNWDYNAFMEILSEEYTSIHCK